jgi:cation diffusion facilitator CzcD-associated flavoprotein CzcO
MNQQIYQVLVIGAGPAGLATSHELKRQNVDHLLLERGKSIGHTWANLYDSLTLHTGKHMSALPGMPFPASVPLFPTRQDFLDYLLRYAAHFQLPITTGCNVTGAERLQHKWVVHTDRGDVEALTLVVATGIASSPKIPKFTGRERFFGRVIHSVEYRRPEPFLKKKVLVVGVGNSGGEIASELARAGAQVTIAVRSGANVLPLRLLGVPIQYYGYFTSKLPLKVQQAIIAITGKVSGLTRGPAVLPKRTHSSCPDVPLIGFHLVDAIRHAGRSDPARPLRLCPPGRAGHQPRSTEPLRGRAQLQQCRSAL